MLRQPKNAALFGALILLMSCGEGVGPEPAQSPAEPVAPLLNEPGVRLLSHRDGLVPGVVRDACPVQESGGPAIQCLSLNPEAALEWSFWAEEGHGTEIKIKFEDVFVADNEDEDVPGGEFIKFKIPGHGLAFYPDGSPFMDHDTVLITIRLDPEDLSIEFSPSGLVFADDDPAELTISYKGTDSDLNADGSEDWFDEFIRGTLLGIWYQADGSGEWEEMASEHDEGGEKIEAEIFHFSNYAVGW